jgi:hypothetical protein
MSVTLTKSGPFYASGAISFSSLRTNFKATDIDGTVSTNTLPISASQLKRITSQSDADPTVPDATENTQISTGNNLSISQFRNSVKYYKASQTATDINLNISTQAWNNNLSKNIKKKIIIGGTIGSSDTNIPALLTTSAQHCNLEIVVTGTGKVLGAGGAGGTANGGSGGNGGTAMNLLNTLAASVIKITVVSGANIYGGGGGGGAGTKGGNGGQGGDGLADGGTTTVYGPTVCTLEAVAGGNPVCPISSGQELVSSDFQGESPKGVFQWLCCRMSVSIVDNADTPTTGGTGGEGGNGGNGGRGEGYDGTDSEGSFGAAGGAGGAGGANAGSGGNGGIGGRGGEGGTYGSNGSPGNQGDTGNSGSSGSVTGGSAGLAGDLPVGNGGTAGKAITGSNYTINPSPPLTQIKGGYT